MKTAFLNRIVILTIFLIFPVVFSFADEALSYELEKRNLNSPVSFESDNQTVADSLRLLAEKSNLNILIETTDTKLISVSFKKAPLADVLGSILKGRDLACVWRGNVLHIIPDDQKALLEFDSSITASFTIPVEKNINLTNIDFIDLRLKDVFRLFSSLTDVNLVMDGNLDDSVTLHFSNLSVQEALSTFIEKYCLQWKWVGKTLYIKPKVIQPLIRSTISLKNCLAEDLISDVSGFTSEVGTFTIDISSNTILIVDKRENIRYLKTFISYIEKMHGSLKEPSISTCKFIHQENNKVSLGKNDLLIRVENSSVSSPNISVGVYLGNSRATEKETIGRFQFPAILTGSGTTREVTVNCKIQLSVVDKSTNELLPFHP